MSPRSPDYIQLPLHLRPKKGCAGAGPAQREVRGPYLDERARDKVTSEEQGTQREPERGKKRERKET